jgi:HEAT repeat protein
VPPGARLVSFDAERGRAVAGAFLEPAWCVQITAEVRDVKGQPVEGVPVTFRLDRRSGQGVILAGSLSHTVALTDARGAARTLLVSSDRVERCRVYARCGAVSLGAAVNFVRRGPPAFTVGLAGARPPEQEPRSAEAELDDRVARLVLALGGGGAEARRVRKEITAMGRAAIGPLLRMIYDEARPRKQRRLAAKALAMVKDELVLDRLLRNLDDRRAAVRSGAESGLFERGVERAGKGVRRVLKLSGPFGRASALRVLAAWGRPGDVALLAGRAGADRDPLVRATAAWKLKAFLDRAEARAAVRAAVADRSAFVRYTAAKALALAPAVSGERSPASFLKEVLGDPDPVVRAAAVRAFRGPACAKRALDLVEDRDVRVRRAATEALEHALAAGAPGVEERLWRLARDRDEHVARLASRVLVRRGGQASAALMLEVLGGRSPGQARVALDSLERVYLVEFGRPGFAALPTPQLVDQWSRWVKVCADLEPHERFWLAAERRSSALRGEAVLAMIRERGADERCRRRGRSLAAGLASSSEVRVRAPACAALFLLGRESARERLLRDLTGGDWPARYHACRAAAFVPRRDVALALVALLADDSAAIRAQAHRSLLALRGGEGPVFDPEGAADARARARALWKKWAESLKIGPHKSSGRGNE